IPPGDKRGAVARNHIVGNVVCFGVECSTDTLGQCFHDYGFARIEDLVVEFGQSVREHVAGESRSCMSRISRWLCHAPDPSWSLPASTRRCARCSSSVTRSSKSASVVIAFRIPIRARRHHSKKFAQFHPANRIRENVRFSRFADSSRNFPDVREVPIGDFLRPSGGGQIWEPRASASLVADASQTYVSTPGRFIQAPPLRSACACVLRPSGTRRTCRLFG